MIIIEDKTKEAIVYIPKTGKAQEPKPSEMTITENGLYEVAGRYNINVDVEGGGNNEELLEEIEQLENEVEQLENEIDRLEDVNTALSTENDTLENELEKAGIDNENLRSEIETLENSIEVLQGEKSVLEAEKRALEEQLEGANSNIEELNNQIDYLNNEITILNNRITTLTNEKKELQKELDKVQKKYDELNNGVYDFRFPDDWTKEHSDIIGSGYGNFFYSPDNTNEKRVVINLEDLYDEYATSLYFKDCTVIDANGRTLQSGSVIYSTNKSLVFIFTGNYFSFEMYGSDWGYETQDIHIAELDKSITHIYTTQLDFNISPKIELTDCPSNSLKIYVRPYDHQQGYFDTELPYWGQQNQITKNGYVATLIPTFGINGSSYNPCGSVISGLNEQIDQLKAEKESLQEQIYNKDREIQTLNAEISNLINRINTLSSEKSALQSQVRTLQSQLNTANQNIANLQSEINTLTNTVNSLTSEKEVLQNQLNDATDRILELDTQISTLETQVDELNGQVSSLTTQLEEKQAEYDTLNQTYQTEVSNLQTDITNLQNTIEEKDSEIAGLNTEIVDLQDDIQNYVANIETLNSEISTLNTQINTLLLEKQQLTTQVETLQNKINSLAEITITENGVYTPNEGVLGYKKITVDVVHFETIYITQAEYDSLSVKENNVFYLING